VLLQIVRPLALVPFEAFRRGHMVT
jgi:hypothetical protein